ncbi:MAG: YcaO-like family protein [Pseudomonadota bacterium]
MAEQAKGIELAFAGAADLLKGESVNDQMLEAQATGIVQALSPVDPHRAALITALESVGGLDRAFLLRHPFAPEFVYLAGQCNGCDIGGGGVSLGEALFRCAGEAAEVSLRPTDLPKSMAPGHPALDGRWPADERRIAARNVQTGAEISLPQSAFLGPRQPGHAPASLGLGAGLTDQDAALSATFELIERDAAHRWWYGETTPMALPLELLDGVTGTLAKLRKGSQTLRFSRLLGLRSPLEVPVVAAISTDPDGRGLAVGLKSAGDWQRAARGAVMEMLQMELALHLARERHNTQSDADAVPFGLAQLHVERFDAFRATASVFPLVPVLSGFDSLASHLSSKGMELYMTRVARPDTDQGYRVAKASAPGLIPLPGPGHAAPAGTPGHETELM